MSRRKTVSPRRMMSEDLVLGCPAQIERAERVFHKRFSVPVDAVGVTAAFGTMVLSLSRRTSGPSRARLVFALGAGLSLALLWLSAAPQAAHAQTRNYSPTGFFTTGFGLSANSQGSPTDELVFAVASLHTAVYDFLNPYYLNKLTFNNTGNLTLARGGGAANQFVLNGTAPTIALNNTGTLTVAIDMALNSLTTVSGTGSATFSGVISGRRRLDQNGHGHADTDGGEHV